MEKLLKYLNSLGIKDIKVLSEKTQRKIDKYNKLLSKKSPIYFDKKTGERKPNVTKELNDLAEDIIIETNLFLEDNNDQSENHNEENREEKKEVKKDNGFLFGLLD